MPQTSNGDSTGVMTEYGQAITRSGGMFAIGMFAIVPFGLVSLAVTTRFLSPSDFGTLAVLYTIGSALTVLGGIGLLHGTLMSVYGISEDDDGGDEVDASFFDFDEDPHEISEERRRLLGSGLIAVIGSSTALMLPLALICALVAGSVAGAFWAASIAAMIASAWAGAIWRLVIQIPRMERRPTRWAFLQYVRPGLVVALSVAALVAGYGVIGVLLATAAGTIVTSLISIATTWRCYRFDFRRGDIRQLWDKGKPWVPLTLAAVFQNNVSIVLLAILATPTSVGLFQVATRIAQVPSFFADGFLTGWPAMEHSPISFAAKEQRGRRDYSASVFDLFCMLTLGLLLFVCLFAGSLVHIAAPAYDSAADLIPIVAAAFGANALFRGLYRATTFPLRRYWFMLLHLVWIVPYALGALLLIPIDASYGVAAAQLIAGAIVSFIFVVVDRRSPIGTPFHWRKLGTALAISAVLVALTQALPFSTAGRAAASILVFLAFPGFIVALGVVPREQLRTAWAIATSLLPKRVDRDQLEHNIAELPPQERDALVSVVCEGRPPSTAAAAQGVSADLITARVTRGLRQLSGGGSSTPIDHLIGAYVLNNGPTIERDSWASGLRAMGVDAHQLHRLDESSRALSRFRSRRRISRDFPQGAYS